MKDFNIVVDSAADLPIEIIKKYDLTLLGLTCNFKRKEYIEDENSSLSYKEFYQGIRDGEMPTTSQVNSQQFFDAFEKIVKDNKAIIYPAFSSALSGTINSAKLAKDEILEKYPDADITIIDTKSASLGIGLLIIKACELKENGASKEEVIKYIEDTKLKIIHLVAMDDLDYLKRGGRLSGTAATLGSILKLKPMIKVNNEGQLINYSKVQGRKKSINTLFKEFEEKAVNINSQKLIAISHSDCLSDAEYLANKIKEKYNVEVLINYIGCVIGSHTGINTLALFFLGDER